MIIASILKEYEKYISLLDNTIKQLNGDEFFQHIADENNSAAVILKHISGNLISRLTNFMTEDGEKDWRNRDGEFEVPDEDMKDLLSQWEIAKGLVKIEVGKLKDEDISKVVRVRGERMSVVEALVRNVSHFSYHVGQIVFIAKTIKGDSWNNQSIPLKKSR